MRNKAHRQPRQPVRPIPESYWVLPGRLLAGEYPGARDQGVARRKVQRLLQAGITCFIDFTEPNEGQLRPYWPHVLEAASYKQTEIEHQRWPIRDMGVPARAHMTSILQAIDQALARNHIVYLHCWGGIGRTGTVVACYLIQQGFDGKAALERLARRRVATETRITQYEPTRMYASVTTLGPLIVADRWELTTNDEHTRVHQVTDMRASGLLAPLGWLPGSWARV